MLYTENKSVFVLFTEIN